MASKTARLPRSRTVLPWARSVKTPYFLLRGRKSGTEKIRIGVVVAKAVNKSAVVRNFLKRQAREALGGFPGRGIDLLVIVSRSAGTLTKKEFRAEILKAARTLERSGQ